MKRGVLLFVTVLLIVAGLVLSGCPKPTPEPTTQQTPEPTTQPATIELKAASFDPDAAPHSVILSNAIQLIEERSEGRIKIDYWPNSSLLTKKTAFEDMRIGVCDIGMHCAGWEPDRMGVVAWSSVGFLNSTIDGVWKDWREHGEFYQFQLPYWAEYNMLPLAVACMRTGDFIGHKFYITPDDFKGQVIRTTAAELEPIKLLGGEPVFMDPSEMYEALQRGTVDAVDQGPNMVIALKLYEVAKKITLTGALTGNVHIVANMDSWHKLPADMQKLIEDCFIEAMDMYYEGGSAQLEEMLNFLTEQGCEIKELTPEQKDLWIEIIEPYFDVLAEKHGDEWTRYNPIRLKLLQ